MSDVIMGHGRMMTVSGTASFAQHCKVSYTSPAETGQPLLYLAELETVLLGHFQDAWDFLSEIPMQMPIFKIIQLSGNPV